MPPTLGDRLGHILQAIDDVYFLAAGQTAETLAIDRIRRMALERALEIICEASRHVPDRIRIKNNQINWREMTDFGNLLRHVYHNININRMLTIVATDLPPLRIFVEKVLREEDRL